MSSFLLGFQIGGRYTVTACTTLEELDDFITTIIKETTGEDADKEDEDSLDEEENLLQ